MQPLNSRQYAWLWQDIRPLAAIISLLLSLWMYLDPYPINYDGILYINAAQVYLEQGLSAAMDIYRWPFYYITFATLSQWLSLSLEQAAYLLNAVLTMVLTITFITIVKDLGGKELVLLFATLIILLQPDLVKWRYYVVRDFGYWTFLLLSLLAFLRFYQYHYWRHAIYWGLCITLATLFRIDGAAFLILVPLTCLFHPQLGFTQRIHALLQAYSFNIITALIPLSLLIIMGKLVFADLSRLHEFYRIALFIINLPQWLDYFNSMAQAYAQANANLGYQVIFSAWLSYSMFLISGHLFVIVKVLEIPQALLSFYAWRQRLMPASKPQKVVLIGFLLIAFIVPLLFIITNKATAFRWVMALVIVLLLWTPFALATLYQHWQTKAPGLTGKRWFFPLLALIMLAIASGGPIRYGPSKAYLRDAATWLNNNTTTNTHIITNESIVAHYAKRSSNYLLDLQRTGNIPIDEILDEPLIQQSYDYIILSNKRNRDDRRAEFIQRFGEPVVVFSNRHNDEVYIFKLTHN